MSNFFCYDPQEGFQLFDSAEDAKKSAQEALEYERQEACEGWSDEVDKICWGQLTQCVAETMRRPRTDADTFVSADCDIIVDYDLVDITFDNS